MVYGHANGSRHRAETVDEVLRYIGMGYKAIRAQTGVPGWTRSTAWPRQAVLRTRRCGDLPSETRLGHAKYLRTMCPSCSSRARGVGFDHHLLHDVHHRYTPIEAARLGKMLEPYRCSGWRIARRPKTRKPSG
jgi:mannonate dehydratase